MVDCAHPHFAAIWGWLKPLPWISDMSFFQSIRPAYRQPDFSASGFPINGCPTLDDMARQKQRTPFGERLFTARKKAKLTQVKLAKAAGMAQGTLAELEWEGQGSSYTPMLAAACGVSAEWLAGAPDAESADPDWPFGSTITRAEWRDLPEGLRVEIVRAARRYVLEYREDQAESGKSSGSGHGAGKRSAQA